MREPTRRYSSELGDGVDIEKPLLEQKRALSSLVARGKKLGYIRAISDPAAWQREQRQPH